MRLYGQYQRAKAQDSFERHIELDLLAGSSPESLADEMSGGQPKAIIGKWLAEKDSGNDSEPELATFSNLNISTKPLHTRPLRGQTKTSDHQKTDSVQQDGSVLAKTDKANAHCCKTSHHLCSTSFNAPLSTATSSDPSKDDKEKKGFTRCLRSRVKQASNKVNMAGSNEVAWPSSTTKTEHNNNCVAQLAEAKPTQYCCDNNTLRNGTLLAMTLSQVPRSKARSRPFDASSLYSVTSDDFNESDDELISINGDCNSEYNSVQSPRLSSKRKRTTTLSADLEVASLLSPSVEDCFSSGDNFSMSDYSEPEEPTNCDIPRKRVCGGVPGDDRPFLDLEKMQDEVEKSASLSNKRRPRAIRIMCFSPIKNFSGINRPATRSQYNSREMVVATQFCPLVPVEYSPDGYS